jgi:hypothetical protein
MTTPMLSQLLAGPGNEDRPYYVCESSSVDLHSFQWDNHDNNSGGLPCTHQTAIPFLSALHCISPRILIFTDFAILL